MTLKLPLCRCISSGLIAAVLVISGCNLVATADLVPTPSLPSVSFLAPQSDEIYAQGSEVIITLVAQDPNGTGIARVELLVDDTPHQEALPEISAAVPIFTVEMNWLAQGLGLHAMTAIAYRLDGTASPPTTIRLLVAPPSGEPTPTSGTRPQVG